ncbi:cation:proton antiporter [Frateuria defendens]|uniref:cation:proton antiporter n=1 Tax=Frateuria defendens TaxID=2219559 RepID=UPI00066FD7E4|nr:cation:proton antiporter [Frateuria defendens]
MPAISAYAADMLVFVALPWLLWKALKQRIPLVVIPIVIGMVLAVLKLPVATLGLPSQLGNQIGFLGVLLLAFTAGMELRVPHDQAAAPHEAPARGSFLRLAASALAALLVPFAVGSAFAYLHLLDLDSWVPAHGRNGLSAAAIGLCMAVSALPVLVGLVRELDASRRPLGQLALSMAVVDDAALWIGLTAIQLAAFGHAGGFAWGFPQAMAVAGLGALAVLGVVGRRAGASLPAPAGWLVAGLYLAVGAWASARLGLHELIGAFFAGAMLPERLVRRLPIEKLGQFALVVMAPMFFGHSGLKIDGNAFGWLTVAVALGLMVLSLTSKWLAVLAIAPVPGMHRNDRIALGSLLQCKGLMEILAATILHADGLLSEHAYAALISLAVVSTVITGPLFQFLTRRRAAKAAAMLPQRSEALSETSR